jgi:hypothetical protein
MNDTYLSTRIYSPLLDFGRFFNFLIFYTVGRTPWTGISPSQNSTNTEKRTQISMLQVGFVPTIPVFERAKTVHALDRAATVIGI